MGAYLSAPVLHKTLSSGETDSLLFGAAAQQGWRLSMEDESVADADVDGSGRTSLFAIFDGHGGCEVSRFLKLHMSAALRSAPGYETDLPGALAAAFLALDAQIGTPEGRAQLAELAACAAAEGHDGAADSALLTKQVRASLLRSAAGAGASAAELAALGASLERHAAAAADQPRGGPAAGAAALVAVLRGGRLTVANAGDCRAVLCRGGTASDLSTDHKPTLDAERERITAAGGFVADGRVNGTLALSRALGDHQFKCNAALPPARQAVTAMPEVRALDLRCGDEFLLLACDGIWDVLSSQQAVDFIRQRLATGCDPATAAAALCDACIAADTGGAGLGCDNMSVMLVLPKPGALAPTTPPAEDAQQAAAAVGARGRSGGGGARQAAAAAARAAAAEARAAMAQHS